MVVGFTIVLVEFNRNTLHNIISIFRTVGAIELSSAIVVPVELDSRNVSSIE